ncbi:hypothetical protein GF360_01815 [candidate division WWE3 bacterium]|nr:hypothetical protein [candidate division WWE3 bacterium]
MEKYDKNVSKKLEIAKKYKINLIKLYPKHLFPKSQLDRVLSDVFYHHAKGWVAL